MKIVKLRKCGPCEKRFKNKSRTKDINSNIFFYKSHNLFKNNYVKI